MTARANGKLDANGNVRPLPRDEREIQDGIRYWIHMHNINCVNLIFNGKKHALDYDFYIDDNPNLATAIFKVWDDTDKQPILLLIDKPYNRCINDDGKRVIRVDNLREAVDKIKELR